MLDVSQSILTKLAALVGRFRYDPAGSFRNWLRTLVKRAVLDLRTCPAPGLGGCPRVAAGLLSMSSCASVGSKGNGTFGGLRAVRQRGGHRLGTRANRAYCESQSVRTVPCRTDSFGRWIRRSHGCKLVVSILDCPESEAESGRRPLYGPIPWRRWLPAPRAVSLCCVGLLALGRLDSVGRIRAGVGRSDRVRPLPVLGLLGPG
jgi:hypothetical protein